MDMSRIKNFNTTVTPGMYVLADSVNTVIGKPSDIDYGFVLIFKSIGYPDNPNGDKFIAQILIPLANDRIYVRFATYQDESQVDLSKKTWSLYNASQTGISPLIEE